MQAPKHSPKSKPFSFPETTLQSQQRKLSLQNSLPIFHDSSNYTLPPQSPISLSIQANDLKQFSSLATALPQSLLSPSWVTDGQQFVWDLPLKLMIYTNRISFLQFTFQTFPEIAKKHQQIIEQMISSKKSNIYSLCSQEPLLKTAIDTNSLPIVKSLLQAGFDPQKRYHGLNALHWACLNGHYQIVKYLCTTIGENSSPHHQKFLPRKHTKSKSSPKENMKESLAIQKPLLHSPNLHSSNASESYPSILLEEHKNRTNPFSQPPPSVPLASSSKITFSSIKTDPNHKSQTKSHNKRFSKLFSRFSKNKRGEQKGSHNSRSTTVRFIDSLTTNGESSLMIAASKIHQHNSYFQIFQFLLSCRPHIDNSSFNFSSILSFLCRLGYYEGVSTLLASGVDPDFPNSNGESPLSWAIFNRQPKIAKLLLKYGANPYLLNTANKTPLYIAAFRDYPSLVALFLQTTPLPKDSYFKDRSPLLKAVRMGHFEVIQILLSAGMSPNATDSASRTPLFYASIAGRKDIVQILLEFGAITQPDNNRHRPIVEYALQMGHINTLKLLLPL